jgi:hypothetical protein
VSTVEKNTVPTANQVALVSTVEKNKNKFSNHDYVRAKMARKIQIFVGRPELKDCITYLDANMIPNCPINRNDAIAAYKVFERDDGSLKGKTTRQKVGHVKSHIVGLPVSIMDRYRTTLCINNMFVNRVGFFMSISRDLHFITAKALTNRMSKEHLSRLSATRFQNCNSSRRLRIECCREIITADLKATLNIAGEDEHVPEIAASEP